MSGPLDSVQLHLVDNLDEALAFKEWLGQTRDVLGLDLETDGLDRTHGQIRLIQFGDADAGWALPWDLWRGVAIEALKTYTGQYVLHNGLFDMHFIDRLSGVYVPRHQLDDSMVMAHLLDSTQAVGLKPLTSRFIDRRAATMQGILDEGMTNNGWTWATVPLDFAPYWNYGALDPVLTSHLWRLLKPQVMATCPKAYDLEMAMTWVAQGMERKGCHLDIEFTREKLTAFEQYVEQAEAWCIDQYGVKPGSTQGVIERLRSDGVEFFKTTNGGALSLDKEVLEGIVVTTGHPLAETVLQRRRIQKLASGYLSNFLEMVDDDSRVRPSIRVLGARTGRMSMSAPALQTLPRRSEANPAAITVRNCITASPGHTLLMCDFAQIEQRLLAHFANDEGLIAAFSGEDFFLSIARELYDDVSMVKKDLRRQICKNSMYALAYGAGAEKIALTSGRPLEVIEDFLTLLGLRFPGIKKFQREVSTVAMRRKQTEGLAYVRSPLTGRRHVADDGKEYALVNFLLQGTACEFFKQKNIELAMAGLDQFLVLDVHDEIVLDIGNDVIDEVAPLVHEIMTDDTTFKVKIESEVSRSFRWGDAK